MGTLVIYVGTCGFSYKDWIGPFYPGTIRSPEMLPYYASCFPAVEIDSSYYGVPAPKTIERMDRATPPEFRFCFKVPSTVTHPPDPGTLRIHPDAALFVQSVGLIKERGKLGCALLQFPNGFRKTPASENYLRLAVEALGPLPLVAEFRNREWQDAQTQRMLAELRVGWCNVDMPRYETLLEPGSDVTSPVGYVRFHGRNAANWWTGTNVTRYDYEYSPEELEPWTNRVAEIQDAAETTFAFFNNHARGSAARNAELFIELLTARYGASNAVVVRREGAPTQRTLFE
jgi:uncharacterized protein YecE (DUF72 family)